MAEHPDTPAELTTLALEHAPGLSQFYLLGGGSVRDLRTDLSHALAAVLAQVRVGYTGPERRQRTLPIPGQERRRIIDLTRPRVDA